MAVQINLYIDQGATFEVFATVANEDGSVFDLTGWTPKGQLRKSYYTTIATDFDITINGDPVDGQLKLSLSPSATNNMRPGRYYYDVEVTENINTNNIKRVLQGTASINPNVTKSA